MLPPLVEILFYSEDSPSFVSVYLELVMDVCTPGAT